MRLEPKRDNEPQEELADEPQVIETQAQPELLEQEPQEVLEEFSDATISVPPQQPTWQASVGRQTAIRTAKGDGIFIFFVIVIVFLFIGFGAYVAIQAVTNSSSGEIVTTETYSPDDAPWVDMAVSFDGEHYQLGETTLQDLLDDGFAIDEEVSSYTIDSTLGKYGEEYRISLVSPGSEYTNVAVGILNPTSKTMKITDCVVYSFNYEDYGNKHVMSIGGISIGDSIDKVKELFGEPYEIYTSGTSKYTTRRYQTTNGEHISLTFYDGEKLGRIVTSLK